MPSQVVLAHWWQRIFQVRKSAVATIISRWHRVRTNAAQSYSRHRRLALWGSTRYHYRPPVTFKCAYRPNRSPTSTASPLEALAETAIIAICLTKATRQMWHFSNSICFSATCYRIPVSLRIGSGKKEPSSRPNGYLMSAILSSLREAKGIDLSTTVLIFPLRL